MQRRNLPLGSFPLPVASWYDPFDPGGRQCDGGSSSRGSAVWPAAVRAQQGRIITSTSRRLRRHGSIRSSAGSLRAPPERCSYLRQATRSHIRSFIDRHNQNPRPFKWTKSPDGTPAVAISLLRRSIWKWRISVKLTTSCRSAISLLKTYYSLASPERGRDAALQQIGLYRQKINSVTASVRRACPTRRLN